MANYRNLREVFDRDNNFVTVKPLKFNGQSYGPGQPFDKSQVTTRRLRQLYDGRYLRMVAMRDTFVQKPPPVQVVLGNAIVKQKVKRVRLGA